MSIRNHFNQLQELFSDTREKAVRYKEKYPERVIGLMFLVLLIAVTIFLITKATHKQSYNSSASTLINRISAPAPMPSGTPGTADIMDLLSLYGKTKAVNPDSLTLKDSLLLKEIYKDLHKILK